MKEKVKEKIVESFNQDDLIRDSILKEISEKIPEKKIMINRKISVLVNNIPYESICAGMRSNGIEDKPTDKSKSPWFKINRELKKNGISIYGDFEFKIPE